MSACSVSGISSARRGRRLSSVPVAVHLRGPRGRRACGRSRPRRAARPRRARRSRWTSLGGEARARARETSSAIASSASGSRRRDVKLRCSAPQFGRRSASSGRASVTMKIGRSVDHSSIDSMKSSRPGSAHWRSSNTMTTVTASVMRSKNARHAAKSSSRSPAEASSRPSRKGEAGLEPPALVLVGDVARRPWRRASSLDSARPSVSAMPARIRTISPSAQNAMPSPYAGQRPWCQKTSSVKPSTYFRNSHDRRDLPMPADPDDR